MSQPFTIEDEENLNKRNSLDKKSNSGNNNYEE